MRVKGFKKLDKELISRGILFKKIAIMHGKDEFSKIKETLSALTKKRQIYAIFYQGRQFPMD